MDIRHPAAVGRAVARAGFAGWIRVPGGALGWSIGGPFGWSIGGALGGRVNAPFGWSIGGLFGWSIGGALGGRVTAGCIELAVPIALTEPGRSAGSAKLGRK